MRDPERNLVVAGANNFDWRALWKVGCRKRRRRQSGIALVESLQTRTLLSGTGLAVEVFEGTLVIRDEFADDDNQITVRVLEDRIRITDSNAEVSAISGTQVDAFTVDVPLSSITTERVVTYGHAGDDTLHVQTREGVTLTFLFSGGAGTDSWTVDATSDADHIEVVAERATGTTLPDLTTKLEVGSGVESLTVHAGSGDDQVVANRVSLANFLFVVDAGPGNGLVLGTRGPDEVSGGPGNDTLIGCAGDDSLSGNEGDDALRGSNGDDILHGGLGLDRLYGQSGGDTLVRSADDDQFDEYDGGPGTVDWLQLTGDGASLDLTSALATRISGLENIDLSGGGGQTLTLSPLAVSLLRVNELTVRRTSNDVVDIGGFWESLPDQTLYSGIVFTRFQRSSTSLNVERAPLPGIHFDFGDAPASYDTAGAGPASHEAAAAGPRLGRLFEYETTPSASENASGDGAEEDGVVFPFDLLVLTGQSTPGNAIVTASAVGLLDGWIDFNADGDFTDFGEQIATSVSVSAGNNPLAFVIPAGAVTGSTFARFRISTAGGLTPTGTAADGEVEDYSIVLHNGDVPSVQTLTLPDDGADYRLSATDTGLELSRNGELIRTLPTISVSELQIVGSTVADRLTIASLPDSLEGRVTVFGGMGNDLIQTDGLTIGIRIEGGVGLDTISGGAGYDTIDGSAGDDLLSGEAGNDRLEGGRGRDTLYGNAGNDLVLGQGAQDFLSGGEGDDRLVGGGSADQVVESGDVDFTLTTDRLSGLGNDELESIESAHLTGGSGDNLIDATNFRFRVSLFGGMGNDTLIGGTGNDLISGGGGSDWVEGGAGSDRLFGDGGSGDTIRGGTGRDTLSGGAGFDVLSVSRAGDFLLSNDRLSRMGDWTRGRVLEPNWIPAEDIESAIFVGSAEDDVFIADDFDGPVTLLGMDGDDQLIGGDDNDIIVGGNGNDALSGGAGDDQVDGGSGDDSLSGGNGDNTLVGGEGVDQLAAWLSGVFELTSSQLKPLGETTGPSDSMPNEDIELATLRTSSGFNAIDASEFPGSVTMNGGSGRDILIGTVQDDVLSGGGGDDGLDGLGGNDLLNGGSGNDTIFGDIGEDTLMGGDGDDLLDGDDFQNVSLSDDANADLIDGGNGRDTLWGGQGNDSLNGGDRDDLLIGRSGIDELIGGDGQDTLVGGSGSGADAGDTFDMLEEIDETFSFDWLSALPSL